MCMCVCVCVWLRVPFPAPGLFLSTEGRRANTWTIPLAAPCGRGHMRCSSTASGGAGHRRNTTGVRTCPPSGYPLAQNTRRTACPRPQRHQSTPPATLSPTCCLAAAPWAARTETVRRPRGAAHSLARGHVRGHAGDAGADAGLRDETLVTWSPHFSCSCSAACCWPRRLSGVCRRVAAADVNLLAFAAVAAAAVAAAAVAGGTVVDQGRMARRQS